MWQILIVSTKTISKGYALGWVHLSVCLLSVFAIACKSNELFFTKLVYVGRAWPKKEVINFGEIN